MCGPFRAEKQSFYFQEGIPYALIRVRLSSRSRGCASDCEMCGVCISIRNISTLQPAITTFSFCLNPSQQLHLDYSYVIPFEYIAQQESREEGGSAKTFARPQFPISLLVVFFRIAPALFAENSRRMKKGLCFKALGRLVRISSTCRHASTPRLSTR